MRGVHVGLVAVVVVLLAAGAVGAEPALKLPLGLQGQAAYVPDDNPPTPEKVALGKQFFWDKRWSKSGTVSCVGCHPPEHGWSDPQQFSLNFAGKPTPRHAPTLVNRLFSDRQLWTGLRASLEDQARNDSNRSDEEIVRRLGAVPEYQQQFRKVFGTELNPDGVAKAIASYVRTIVSGNSPYDRFRAGDKTALSPAAQRGLAIFEGKGQCVRCHAGFNFTDEGYRNIGVGMDKEKPDLGRFVVTKSDPDRGAFKTPTLRDVANRGPYMHDGSLRTLEEVVAFYNRGGHKNPWLASEVRPLDLTAPEEADLVVFLRALTGEIPPEVGRPPRLPN
ncbi:MAG TPA: cytochrome c peroxidase [Methylomirabilota bacterium]|jgi:cytochrome c peroxidase|nr:cytochrome c peroxidase [Methylomirabilota bacterium]